MPVERKVVIETELEAIAPRSYTPGIYPLAHVVDAPLSLFLQQPPPQRKVSTMDVTTEHTYTDEARAHEAANSHARAGRGVSLVAFDGERDLYTFDVTEADA